MVRLLDDNGIDENDRIVIVGRFVVRVDDHHLHELANLRGGKADSGIFEHLALHTLGERLDFRRYLFDGLALLPQARVGRKHDSVHFHGNLPYVGARLRAVLSNANHCTPTCRARTRRQQRFTIKPAGTG